MSKVSWDILQCPLAKRCRACWQRLEPVQGDPAIRFCAACERSVYLCQTDEDLSKHSALGRCVALEIPYIGVAHIGEPLPLHRYGVAKTSHGVISAAARAIRTVVGNACRCCMLLSAGRRA